MKNSPPPPSPDRPDPTAQAAEIVRHSCICEKKIDIPVALLDDDEARVKLFADAGWVPDIDRWLCSNDCVATATEARRQQRLGDRVREIRGVPEICEYRDCKAEATGEVTYSDNPDVTYPHCERHAAAFRPPCDEECGEPATWFVPLSVGYWCDDHLPGSVREQAVRNSFPQEISESAGILFFEAARADAGSEAPQKMHNELDEVRAAEDLDQANEDAEVIALLDNLLLATMINARFSAVNAGLALAITEHGAPHLLILPRAAKQFAAAMGSYNALAADLYPDATEDAPAPERTPAPQKLPENACPRCKGTGKIMVAVPAKGGTKVIAPHVCSVCAGSGTRPERREQTAESTEGFERPAQQQQEVECAACKGKKKIVGADFKLTECPTCGGRGVVSVIPSGRTPYPEEEEGEEGGDGG